MPNPLTYYVSQAKSVFNSAGWDCNNAWVRIATAGILLESHDYAGAGAEFRLAYLDGLDLSLKLHSRYNFQKYYLIDALDWIDDNWPAAVEPVEVNMESILAAMLAADPEEVTYFVGLVDAYRQSIWNRPFNREFFASLARGFETWE